LRFKPHSTTPAYQKYIAGACIIHHPPYVVYKPPHRLLLRFLPRMWIVNAAGGGYLRRDASIGLIWQWWSLLCKFDLLGATINKQLHNNTQRILPK
jgi:hypothetical protein